MLVQISIFYKSYKISNKEKSDIDWNTLKDNSTLHKILWIQSFRDISFSLLLVDQYLIIVGDSYPIDYDEAVSGRSFLVKHYEGGIGEATH